MRVVVVSDKSIFGEGLMSLLAQCRELEVVGHVQDLDGVEADIELLRPEVLIVDCADDMGNRLPALLQYLRHGWVEKIVEIRRQGSDVCIISGERQVVDEVSSLVDAIAGEAADSRSE